MCLRAGRDDIYVGCHGDLGGFGGSAVVGRDLAVACRRSGWNPFLLGFVSHQADRSVRIDGLSGWNVDVSPQPGLWRVRAWCLPRRLARRLQRLGPPRVAFVAFSPLWTVAAKHAWPQVPVVARFCGLLSHCVHFARPASQRPGFWSRICAAGERTMERRAMRAADLILVPAREHIEEITQFEPAARPRVRECAEGGPRPEYSPGQRRGLRARLGLAESDFLILAVGCCDRNKGFDHAIRELRATDQRGQLVVVGDGPVRPELEALARELGLGRRARLVGRQPDLGPWYAAADCVVSTSFYDTFPNVIKEALWCGRPVVVPAHDPPRVYAGWAGLLERESAGLLYDRLRPGALAECLNHLIQGEARRGELAARGYALAQRLFTWDETIREIAALAQREDPRGAHAAGALNCEAAP